MNSPIFEISAGEWFGLRTLPGTPCHGACWANTPILVTEVTPLKTGGGLLQLSVVEALQPVEVRRRTIVLKVRHRQHDHLIGTFKDHDDTEQVAMLSDVTEDWLKQHCHDWWRRFPSRHFANPFWEAAGIGITEYLARAFPGRADEIGRPVLLPRAALQPMPDGHAVIPLNYEFDEMDAFLIRRGFRSSVMEEKWDAEFCDDTLRLYRGWTGVLIYEIPTTVRGARLYAASMRVNRDPRQYPCNDDAFDKAMCAYVICRVLLGLPAEYPAKSTLSADQAAIAAWSTAGKASL